MKFRSFLTDAVLVVAAITSVVGAYVSIDNKIAFQAITSRSMEPTFQAGDIIMTRQANSDEIRLRDVVVLPLPEKRELSYSHRIIELKKYGENILIRTKGDANPKPDTWALEITSDTLPKVIGTIPSAPILNSVVGRRTLFLTLLSGGIALLLLGIWRIVRRSAT